VTSVEIPYSIACALPSLTVIDITNDVSHELVRNGHKDGIAYISPADETGIVRVNERETGFFEDLEDLLERLVPLEVADRERLVRFLIGPRTEQIPFRDAELCLGTWQRVLLLGFNGSAINAMGQGYELRVIAATVIGGANLMGGAGTAYGAVIGSALLEVIRNALLMAGIDSNWQGAFVGAFIVLAVLLGMQTGGKSIIAAIMERLLPRKHR